MMLSSNNLRGLLIIHVLFCIYLQEFRNLKSLIEQESDIAIIFHGLRTYFISCISKTLKSTGGVTIKTNAFFTQNLSSYARLVQDRFCPRLKNPSRKIRLGIPTYCYPITYKKLVMIFC